GRLNAMTYLVAVRGQFVEYIYFAVELDHHHAIIFAKLAHESDCALLYRIHALAYTAAGIEHDSDVEGHALGNEEADLLRCAVLIELEVLCFQKRHIAARLIAYYNRDGYQCRVYLERCPLSRIVFPWLCSH